ncbi:MAG: hypothetical protein ABI321_11280 [Polyangia bacterium]
MSNVIVKISSGLLAGVLSLGFSGLAHATFQSKGELARGVTARTGAAQSTVVGRSSNRTTFYVRSEGTNARGKYLTTRRVDANTGAIKGTSGNQLGKIKQAVALAERNGGKGGMTHDFAYHVRANRNLMTNGGNVKISVDNAGFPGHTEGRLVTLTKTGAIKHITDSATDGRKSRW